jgi:hypothetical protein
MPNIGQVTYQQFPNFAVPGQLADLAYNEIQSFPAAEVINPGRMVEMASDGLSIQQVQAATTTAIPNSVGIAVLLTAREGQGAVGVTAYGVQGPTYQAGEMVPVLMRGRVYAEWKGTTQTNFSMPNVYHSGTTATDRGKFTDASPSASSGTEVSNAGNFYRVRQALPGTGSIVLVDVNLPGTAS